VAWPADVPGVGLTLLLMTLVFGLVNTFIRPIARLVSVPLNIATLGLFSIVINAALLLGVAFLLDLAVGPVLVVGGYPPDLGLEAVMTATIGSLIISSVSTALALLIPQA
jgi:putative membrane protein